MSSGAGELSRYAILGLGEGCEIIMMSGDSVAAGLVGGVGAGLSNGVGAGLVGGVGAGLLDDDCGAGESMSGVGEDCCNKTSPHTCSSEDSQQLLEIAGRLS